MKTIVANSVLPSGAKEIVTIRKKIGGWVEMEYDAECERYGLTWLRVKGGFNSHGGREDWVCDLPTGLLSVSDSSWREPRFGFDNFSSFDEAVAGEIRRSLSYAESKTKEKEREADESRETEALLRKSVSKLPSP